MKHPIIPGWTPCVSALLAIAFTGVTGCTTTPSAAPVKEQQLESWKPLPASAAAQTNAPLAPLTAPVAVVSTPADEPPRVTSGTLPTQMIGDLDLSGSTDVATVLRALGRVARINLLVSPRVSGTVSFTFQNVPWDQAFRSVLASAGLTYTWEGDVLRVMTVEDMKQELQVETIRKERETVKAELRKVQPLQLAVIRVRYMRASSLGGALQSMLMQKGPGEMKELMGPVSTVTVDEDNNALVIHATPEDLAKVQNLIAELDRPKPQIRIEARIVEANRDTARQLGVQWGGLYKTADGGRIQTVGGPGVTAGGYNSDFPSPFAVDPTRPYGFTLGFVSEKFGGGQVLNMQLTALQRDGRIRIVSSPSVTTMDNQPAEIESGEERAYRKTTGTGNILDVSLEWKKAVLKLKVTPHVVDGRRMRLDIEANKDSFDETKPQSNGEFPVNTKRASTTVMLLDGETAVIGGLARESESDSNTGVPFLKDIPLLGYFFKNRSTSALKDDTLIFITPTILRESI